MGVDFKMSPEVEQIARHIADEIKHRRNGLNYEESENMRLYHPTYVRARKHRDQDRSQINGMVIALTYVLDRPNDMTLAEAFIADSPEWRALL